MRSSLLDGGNVGWFAPRYKLLLDPWRDALTAFAPYVTRKDTSEKRIEFSTGACMDFWSMEDEDCGRSRKYDIVFVDEAGLSKNLLSRWDEAIRPTLTDREGGAFFMGTPKGHNGFFELEQRAERQPDLWATHHAPTLSNPHIKATEVDQARMDLPERIFAQEYLADYLDSGGGVFRFVNAAIDQTLCTDSQIVRAEAGGSYIISCDFARHEDFTVFCVFDCRSKTLIAIDRFNQTDYLSQMTRLRALSERFPGAPIIGEENNMGGPFIEFARQFGGLHGQLWGFVTTPVSKAALVQDMQLAFERQQIKIPSIPWLISELMAFEQGKTPSGSIKYGAPSGQHDDGVMALMIGWSRLFEGFTQRMGARVAWL